MPQNHKYITTESELKNAFIKLGVKSGMHIMVHASMSKLGYVVNGANDVIDALFNVVGGGGTVLVSANTSQITDPSEWKNPPVPCDWVETIRNNMKPFDAKTTPIRGRGVVPDAFMLYPGVCRSKHPVKSIAAKGRLAEYFTSKHPLHESEGVGSPLHKLYLEKGYSLMLGVDLTSCSAIHLSEFLADVPYLYENNFKAFVVDSDGKRDFVELKKYPLPAFNFNKLINPLKERNLLKEIVFKDTKFILMDVFGGINYAVECLKRDYEYFRKP